MVVSRVSHVADRSVHLRPAIAEPVDLVLARNVDDAFLAGAQWVELRVEDARLLIFAFCQKGAVASQNATHADEAKAALDADAVDSGKVNMILEGAGRDDDLGGG